MEAAELRERLAESAGGVHGLAQDADSEARVVAATERADALEAAAAASQSVIEKLLEENEQLTETINRLGRRADASLQPAAVPPSPTNASSVAEGTRAGGELAQPPTPAPLVSPLKQSAADEILPDDYFDGEDEGADADRPRAGFFGSILSYISGAAVTAGLKRPGA